MAAAIAHESFADVRATSRLEQALAGRDQGGHRAVLAELRLLAPGITVYVEPAPVA